MHNIIQQYMHVVFCRAVGPWSDMFTCCCEEGCAAQLAPESSPSDEYNITATEMQAYDRAGVSRTLPPNR
jgi:hypothetical protein